MKAAFLAIGDEIVGGVTKAGLRAAAAGAFVTILACCARAPRPGATPATAPGAEQWPAGTYRLRVCGGSCGQAVLAEGTLVLLGRDLTSQEQAVLEPLLSFPVQTQPNACFLFTRSAGTMAGIIHSGSTHALILLDTVVVDLYRSPDAGFRATIGRRGARHDPRPGDRLEGRGEQWFAPGPDRGPVHVEAEWIAAADLARCLAGREPQPSE